MASVSKPTKAKGKSNLPNHQLVIKVNTSKGYVTLGKVGLYDESNLHSKVAKLSPEQLVKLLANAELSIQPYSSSNTDENIELII